MGGVRQIAAAAALVSLVSLTARAQTPQLVDTAQIRVGGYTFIWGTTEHLRPEIEPPPGVGHLRVVRTIWNGKELVVYEETTPLSPGCGNYPTTSTIDISGRPIDGQFRNAPNKLVLLCGSDGGRHTTLKVFHVGQGETPQVATLDFFDTRVNLAFDDELDGYAALVVRRDLLSDAGPTYFPFVYRLHVDQSTVGFSLVFGKAAAKRYEHYYRDDVDILKKSSEMPADLAALRATPAVAALLATEDRELICRELPKVPYLPEERLQEQIDMAASLGYPPFDYASCGARP